MSGISFADRQQCRRRALRASLCNRETHFSGCKLRCNLSILRDVGDKFGLPPGISNSQVFSSTSLLFCASVTRTLLKIASSKPRWKRRVRDCKCQEFEPRRRWVFPSVRILFWVRCVSLPCCPVKRQGQATKREHMPASYSAAAPDMCYFLLT